MTSSPRIRAHGRIVVTAVVLLLGAAALSSCAPPAPRDVQTNKPVKAGEYDPAEWGKSYPLEYQGWLDTKNPRPVGKSKYKRGGDAGRQFDKLSEYPYMSALTTGFGFAVEYNEPRGHWWAMYDQKAIDPARLKAGGVCLACKSPYFGKLRQENGDKIFSMPYDEAVAKIPKRHRFLGPACIDCHDEQTLELRSERQPLLDAVKTIGVKKPTKRQQQMLVCGQCHCTYVIPKTPDLKSKGLFYPWKGGTWGDISVEDIIADMQSDPANGEWTQKLTGFKLGYIRHPEFELYTRQSTHFVNGVTCPDCHMPFEIKDGRKFSNHDVKGALDFDMQPCLPCHPQSRKELREAVIRIQDQVVGVILNAGYAVTADATLFEIANSRIDTNSAANAADYAEAKQAYIEAFYRVAYLGAENSVGFHNPTEANRIGANALAYSQRSAEILRKMLARNGVEVPNEVQLDLIAYLKGRGVRGLAFDPKLEFKDPSGVAEQLWKNNLEALRSGKELAPPLGTSAGTTTPSPSTTASPGATRTP